jgi:hypothetical protein
MVTIAVAFYNRRVADGAAGGVASSMHTGVIVMVGLLLAMLVVGVLVVERWQGRRRS